MAQSGPEKPVRRSIVGSEQPREVFWGERRAPGSDQSVARGCCARSCLRGEAAGDRLQSVLSLFRGWDAIHQDFMLVDQPHDMVRAATGVEGICGLDPRGVRLAPRESLATHMVVPWPWSQRLVNVLDSPPVQEIRDAVILLRALDPEVGLWELAQRLSAERGGRARRQVALHVVRLQRHIRMWRHKLHVFSLRCALSLLAHWKPATLLSLAFLGSAYPWWLCEGDGISAGQPRAPQCVDLGRIPLVLLGGGAGPLIQLLAGRHLTVVSVLCLAISERLHPQVQPTVLVRGLRQVEHALLPGDLTVPEVCWISWWNMDLVPSPQGFSELEIRLGQCFRPSSIQFGLVGRPGCSPP